MTSGRRWPDGGDPRPWLELAVPRSIMATSWMVEQVETREKEESIVKPRLTLRTSTLICWAVFLALLSGACTTVHAGHGGCCSQPVRCDVWCGCHAWREYPAYYGSWDCHPQTEMSKPPGGPTEPIRPEPKKNGGPPEPAKEKKAAKKAEAKPLGFRDVGFHR